LLPLCVTVLAADDAQQQRRKVAASG
jgi:hypothetical protein